MSPFKVIRDIIGNTRDIIDFVKSVEGLSHKHRDGSRSLNKLGLFMTTSLFSLILLFFYSILITRSYNNYRELAELIRPGISIEILQRKEKKEEGE